MLPMTPPIFLPVISYCLGTRTYLVPSVSYEVSLPLRQVPSACLVSSKQVRRKEPCILTSHHNRVSPKPNPTQQRPHKPPCNASGMSSDTRSFSLNKICMYGVPIYLPIWHAGAS
ncbi:hypothetical protein BO70DRAFT_60935 [Aspergillus heteromorphus CBS 117.55]|uniref:Uncharacterized protein n=1 Tax=Aspergillus heteromorphus CBS 117.55 TaxID=1448321 RepID=A0A317VV66_9EURO|nr:uncharacterized protein BO70DRAFT_60935 [Aspergillus heteromorphus CBS 117.55]PWY78276.1 hypothetical protein BO70DRAFT_60935 [Aspergillus heteromorphus CBS 117.55]